MDEREVANFIFSAVDSAAYQHKAKRVVRVVVAIGGRRVFDSERLSQAFAVVTRGTVADGAQLEIRRQPVRYHCGACGNGFVAAPEQTGCAVCGNPHAQAISGDELRLVNIDVEQAPTSSRMHKEAS